MRMPRRAIMAALAISAIVTSVAAADSQNQNQSQSLNIAAGSLEFTPTLAFNRTSFTVPGGNQTASITHFDFNPTVGYAVNEQFQALGGVLVQHHAGLGADRWSYGASFGGQLNMAAQGGVTPFASMQVGFIQYSGEGQDRAMLLPMMRLGVRTWIGDQRSLNVSVGYHHETNPESSVRDDANVFDIGVGVSMMKAR